ncbi:hypothetical protein D9M71_133600 [compost metagenome]
MDLRGEQFGQRAARGFLPTGAAGEIDIGVHGEAHAGQYQLLGTQLVRVEAHGLAQAQPGFDAAVFTGRTVVVQQALNPLAADLAVRAVGQNGRVLQGDVHLIVETVGDPALDLFAGGPAFVHRHVIGVMDVVVGALGAQGRFEFGGGHRGVSHCGSPGNNQDMCCCCRPHREQARSHRGMRSTGRASLLAIGPSATAQYSCRHTPLQPDADPVPRVLASLHRESGWCC